MENETEEILLPVICIIKRDNLCESDDGISFAYGILLPSKSNYNIQFGVYTFLTSLHFFLFIGLIFFSLPFSFSIPCLEKRYSVHSLSFQVYFRFESRHPKMCSIRQLANQYLHKPFTVNESNIAAKLTNRQLLHHNFRCNFQHGSKA